MKPKLTVLVGESELELQKIPADNFHQRIQIRKRERRTLKAITVAKGKTRVSKGPSVKKKNRNGRVEWLRIRRDPMNKYDVT